MIKKLKDYRQRETSYFEQNAESIFYKNFITLDQLTNLIAYVFLVIFIGCLIFFRQWNWRPPISLMTLIPIIIALKCILYYIRRHTVEKVFFTQQVTGIFYFLFLIEVIFIDLYPRTHGIVVFYPIVVVVLPLLFILRYQTYFCVTLVSEIIFCLFVSLNKGADLAVSQNTFISLVATLISMETAKIIQRARMSDETEKSELRIENQFDYLTGIYNRKTVEQIIHKQLTTESNPYHVLWIIDIDDFKQINDIYGHKIGDGVLAEFGKMLKSTFPEPYIVGRLGGDEFIVFCKDKSLTHEQVERFSQQLIDACTNLSFPSRLTFHCSIGAVRSNSPDFEQDYELADLAMYDAKKEHKGYYYIKENLT